MGKRQFALSVPAPRKVSRWRLMRTGRRQDGAVGGHGGFTLIEMMVALFVFALAALALIRLEGATIRGAGILDTALAGQIVARNVAIEAVTDAKAPTLGIATGTEQNGGKAWAWTRTVAATGDQRILRIDVAVTDSAGRPAGKLTMIRAAASS